MIENIKSVLIGLTKEFGPDEIRPPGYGLSLASRRVPMPLFRLLPSSWT